MNKIEAIKPGPKPKKEDGTDDKRRRVDPPTKPKHPTLKPHIHKPKDQKGIFSNYCKKIQCFEQQNQDINT